MIDFLRALTPHISPIIMLVQVILGLFIVLLATKFATKAEHKALTDKVDAHDSYIDTNRLEMKHLSDQIANLPSAATIHELSIQMTELKGELKVSTAKFQSMSELSGRMQMQIDRMDEFLKRPR